MSSIPIKFSTTTYRVKSLSFHPHRPWLLVGLADGTIQIWDYRLENLIHTFTECGNSPVRCILWHPTQPIFASCGDDQLIRIFNYQKKTCLFVLQGHNDYVRSLQFHHEQPWLLSASDDQTVRIWNWQSRQCICEVLGHHYYVMDAKFHPFLPLIATASLDNTVRIWNYSQLLKKQNGGLVPPTAAMQQQMSSGSSSSALDQILPDVEVIAVLDQVSYINTLTWYYHQPTSQTYLFFAGKDSDIKVFTLNDNTLSTYHHETLRTNGHTGSITSIIISQQSDSGELLTCSEDGTAKIWAPILNNGYLTWNGGNNTTPIQRPEGEKVWAGAIDNKSGRLYAVGYETGFSIFKISRERYGYGIVLDQQQQPGSEMGKVYWMCSKQLLVSDLYTASAAQLNSKLLDSPNAGSNSNSLVGYNNDNNVGKDPLILYTTKQGHKLSNAPQYVRSFYINVHNKLPTQTHLIFTKSGTYNLVIVQNGPQNQSQQQPNQLISTTNTDTVKDMYAGNAKQAVFVTNTRFVVLTKENELVLLSLQNEMKRRLTLQQITTMIKSYITDESTAAQHNDLTSPSSTTTMTTTPSTTTNDTNMKPYTPIGIFPAMNGFILVRIPEYILLLDLNTMKIISDFPLPARLTVKRTCWSSDFTSLVICTKTLLYFFTCDITSPLKPFTLQSTYAESSRIKSLCFDNILDGDVLLFNTTTHLKFLLKNGHVGVLKTLNDVCYLSTLTAIPHHIQKQQQHEREQAELESQGKITIKNDKKVKKSTTNSQQEASIQTTPYDRYLHYFTRQGKYVTLRVNCIEYIFKHALHHRVTQIVAEIMFSGLLNGNNVIYYVCDMGYYDLALHLSTDIREKFMLSLQCGNLKDAIDCAIQINEPKIWEELSFFALQCGNVLACEQAYINTKNIYLLSFLYILTGQLEKLHKITTMCLSNPPSINNGINNGDEHNTYEVGLWLSFFLGQHSTAITNLYQHLTAPNNTPSKDPLSTLISTNNIFNKPTILMLLRSTCQSSLLLTSSQQQQQQQSNNDPILIEKQQTTQNLLDSITNELNDMNNIYKTTSVYETKQILHESNPINMNVPITTLYEDVLQRSQDCVGSFTISADYLHNVLNHVTTNNDDTLEDELVDLLLNANDTNYSDLQQIYNNNDDEQRRIKLPLPYEHLQSIIPTSTTTTSNDINEQFINNNNLGTLISPWAYLSQQADYQSQSTLITTQQSSPWPLLPLQQLQQQQQQQQSTTNAKKYALSTTSQQQTATTDDSDWFQDILSHAEGLASGGNGIGTNYGTKTNNGQDNNTNITPSAQETWDLDDLDLGDDIKTTNGANNDDFMDFDNNNNITTNQNTVSNTTNTILTKFGQLLTLPDGPNVTTNWLADLYQPQTLQTTSTARQFLSSDFTTGFYNLQQQIAPTINMNQSLITTMSKNALFSHYQYIPYLSSLSHLDSTTHLPTTNPELNDVMILPGPKIPLQFTMITQPPQQLGQQQLQLQPQLISLPFNPITITTIKDRYQLSLQYLYQGAYDQSITSFRSLLQLLPLTNSLPTSYHNNTDLKFLYYLPYYTREYILWLLCDQAKNKTENNILKAIYGILSTFTYYDSITIQSQQEQQLSTTGIILNLQSIYDIMINTLWVACKYLYPLNNFQLISILCRKILSLGQQYNNQYQSNLVQFDTVKKMLKKCEVEGYKDSTPLTFTSPITKTNEKFDYQLLLQLQQQTQHIGSVSFVSKYQPIDTTSQQQQQQTEYIPKGINILVCSKSMLPITTTQILQTNIVLCSFCQSCAYNHFINQQCNVCQLGTYGGVTTTQQNGLQFE